jgi:Cu/Ag efflux protein CusF
MPIEYAGYVPSETRVNWEGLTDEFAKKTTDVIKARQGERQALDQIAIENNKMINEQELGKTQTVNDFLVKSGFDVKYGINDLNKELKAGRITPEEYRRSMNNITSNWGIFANSAKTYDTKRQEILARQEVNKETGKIPASQFELELQKNYEETLDMANNKLHLAKNGNMMLGKVDPKTGEIIGQLQDVRSLNIPENIMANRVDVNTSVKTFTDEWKANKVFKDLGRGGELTIEDIRLNAPEFDLAVTYLAKQISGTPRQALSLLIDNGPVSYPNYFYKDEDRESIKAEAIAQLAKDKAKSGMPPPTKEELDGIDLSMIKLKKGADGVINPELTEKQNEAATNRVKNEVEMQFPTKEDGKAKQDWYHAPASRDGGDGDGSGSTKKLGYETYLSIKRAFDTSDGDILNALVPDGKFSFKWNNNTKLFDVSQEYSLNDRGDKVYSKRPVASVKNAVDLSTYIYPEKSEWGDQRQQFAKQKELAISENAVTYSTPGEEKFWTDKKLQVVSDGMKKYKVNAKYKEEIKALIKANPTKSAYGIIKDFKPGKKTDSLGIL